MTTAIKTPTGALTSSFGNASKFASRLHSKDTILELVPELGSQIIDEDFASDPEDGVDIKEKGWKAGGDYQWDAGGFESLVTTTGYIPEALIWEVLGDVPDIEALVEIQATRNTQSCAGIGCRISGNSGYFAGTWYNWYYSGGRRFCIGKFVQKKLIYLAEDSTNRQDQLAYKLRFRAIGPILKLKFWLASEAEPTTGGPDNDGYQLKAIDDTYSTGRVGLAGLVSHGTDYNFDDFEVWPFSYPDTSPVRYAVWDSGEPGSAWAAGTAIVKTNVDHWDAGTVKVKEAYSDTLYGAGQEADVDAIASGSWLTPNASDEVTLAGGTGRYRYLLYQFNSNGSQQTSLAIYDEGHEVELDSPPARPTLVSATPGDTEIVLQVSAANASDVIYARYRTPAGAWSAESDTFKRTGSGTITLTGLTNEQRYQVAVYTRNDILRSTWDHAYATPTAGATDPTGLVSLPLQYLRKTIAASSTFQGWVGAAEALESVHTRLVQVAKAEANLASEQVASIDVKERGSGYTSAPAVTVHGNGTGATATASISGGVVTSITVNNGGSGYTKASVEVAVPTMPFAIADWAENFARVLESQGLRNYFAQDGDLIMLFRAAVDPSHTEQEAAFAFTNKIGAIIKEMEEKAGTAGYLDITEIALADGPQRPDEDEKATVGDFYQVVYRVGFVGL